MVVEPTLINNLEPKTSSKKRAAFKFITIFVVLVATFVTVILYIYGSPFETDVHDDLAAETKLDSENTDPIANRFPKIADYILRDQDSTVFADAIKTYNYDYDLTEEGPYTVFLPTDEAYKNVPKLTAENYLSYDQEANFKNVLNYHVVRGIYLTSDFKDGMTLDTEQGEKITITRKDNFWILNGYAYIELSDIPATNGVIHKTTNFIFPPSMVSQQP